MAEDTLEPYVNPLSYAFHATLSPVADFARQFSAIVLPARGSFSSASSSFVLLASPRSSSSTLSFVAEDLSLVLCFSWMILYLWERVSKVFFLIASIIFDYIGI